MLDPMEFDIDQPESIVYVVGLGPGDVFYLTQEAQAVLENADAICGYKLYLDLIEPEFPCDEYYATGMTQEIDRCRWALEKAGTGKRVALVCSGDAGVYGMASPLLELAEDYPDVAVEVVPGLTAALSGGPPSCFPARPASGPERSALRGQCSAQGRRPCPGISRWQAGCALPFAGSPACPWKKDCTAPRRNHPSLRRPAAFQ